MKIKLRNVYTCSFCSKNMLVKSAMERHEKHCSQNPEILPACYSCNCLKDTRVKNGRYKGFVCTKKDVLLYPPKVEAFGYLEKYPETFKDQEPMPKSCPVKEDHILGMIENL